MNEKFYSRFILSAVLGLVGVFSTAAIAGGDPPSVPSWVTDPMEIISPVVDPIVNTVVPIANTVANQVCKDIPNPVVEACKAEISCYTGPVGGSFCDGQVPAVCSQSGSVQDRALAAINVVVGDRVCDIIAPGNQAMMVASAAQMISSCGTSAAGTPPPSAINQFCTDIQGLPDRACSNLGPATINICKSPADW